MHYKRSSKGMGAPRGAATRRLDSGQVFVLTAMALTVLVGFASMTLDVGFLWNLRRKAQTAADAAAIGGMLGLASGSVAAAALNDAAQNGFPNGVNNTTVTVNNPPASGNYRGDPNAVEVIVTQGAPSFFLRMFGFKTVPVTARAVAHKDNSPDCLYALDPLVSGALSAGGTNATINAPKCAIQVNSSNIYAMNVTGGDCINAASIGIVGNYTMGTCAPSPTPITGVVPAADPLASLAAPSIGSCNYTNFKLSAGATQTLNPGVYCGGITLTGGSTALLNAGTYILNGGGLAVSAGSNIKGSGVTFYNTGSSKSYIPISLQGSGNTILSAPTSGPFEGILFFQDRSIISKAKNVISGSGTDSFEGALYFPTTYLMFGGGSSITAYTLIVADIIEISGNSTVTLNADYSSLADGSPIKTQGLVE
jgi:putative Tad-like protein involved in Flp pilus assembly